ncbi:hypothetical protein CBU02nite_06190 [Clostridium butyricum]|uniref:DUF1508 domain-containing protein n=1 Tax=Clostridium butyricum TaxID=1492 RepID=A0A512TIX6_CLOBU|nr:hypothetical protein [Clostridium butyricum]NOW23159.1 hypothetical protein [Clostridium butyricum]GEQ20113.1 hypothetical protein CBU02nite_06190 [Clostridium butyricum]
METYHVTIMDKNIDITVNRTSNNEYPYYAVASYKNIDGAGKTVEEARKKCESAVKIELIMNPW